ncbi:MAG TPA: GNAT family N-acetyltransferase [Candidatus Hydrogenedentes bacterium]|nr:GNAT family N-acetyltransferase [Candidatus Hydrogenedentota bacterium]HNT88591.1 GNAT family N-acetyltransferase [Candidatus Hydrogenedentota bacterium]
MTDTSPKATIELTTWFLDMHAPPSRPSPPRKPDGLEMVRVYETPIHFYRYLYNKISEPWVWWERKRQTDDEIRAELHDPAFEFFVPYLRGAPIGMVELNCRNPEETQLNYFGIIPEYCGRGYGGYALAWSVDHVWARKPRPRRYWVHTCSQDSPAALPCYQKAGFVLYDTVAERIPDPASVSPT